MRVVILLALLGTALAAKRPMNRIVGGDPVNIDRYPFMSNVQYLYFGFWWIQWCGGSLLTSTVVMSAAHCFETEPTRMFRVFLGTSFASSGGTTHTVSRIINHPRYNDPYMDNDITLLVLTNPAVFSNNVGVARIPATNFVVPDGADVATIGWGAIVQNGPSSEQLLHAIVNVINQELCAERYAYLKTLPGFAGWPDISDGMLCAGILDVGGKDACQGDSGGPLAYQEDIVVGVTSWGFGCAHAVYPGVNARVSHYSNWIVDTVNSLL